jgi:hypothetical protein
MLGIGHWSVAIGVERCTAARIGSSRQMLQCLASCSLCLFLNLPLRSLLFEIAVVLIGVARLGAVARSVLALHSKLSLLIRSCCSSAARHWSAAELTATLQTALAQR